jgi:hypothetical protein
MKRATAFSQNSVSINQICISLTIASKINSPPGVSSSGRFHRWNKMETDRYIQSKIMCALGVTITSHVETVRPK